MIVAQILDYKAEGEGMGEARNKDYRAETALLITSVLNVISPICLSSVYL